jgi:hypothetical protein
MPSAATRLASIGWRMARNAAERDADGLDPTDPVHVAEFGCYLASSTAGWINGQTFQVRGATIEHIGSWRVERTVTRADRGWTAAELDDEIPRAFGAGSKRSDPPPDDWRERYTQARLGSESRPSSPS